MDLDAHGGYKRGFQRLGGDGGGGGPSTADTKQKVCNFWRAGKCNRFPCPYLHRELPMPPAATANGAATKRFANNTWGRSSHNNNNNNIYRAGNNINNIKVDKLCRNWVQGNCMYGEKCKYLHSWTVGDDFKLLTQLEGHQKVVSGITLPSGSDKLYSGGKDETVRVWDCASGQMMDDASLLGIALPEDVLHTFLAASNSSSLKEALEILIESSRTAVGRSALASKNVLSNVLQLIQSISYSTGCQYLLLSLKLLRNLSAGEITNQNSFIEQNGVGIVLRVLRSAGADSVKDHGIIRMALQVLANVSLAGEKHQRAIWCLFFPNEFVRLAGIRSQETCDPLCMVIYTCCDGSPGLFEELCGDKGFPILAEIVHTASSVGFKEDWFKLLVSRVCVEEIYFPQLFSELRQVGVSGNLSEDAFSSEQTFLLRIASEIVNERIEEITVPNVFALCVLRIFRRSVGLVDFFSRGTPSLPTVSTATNVLGYSLSILRDICAQEDPAGSRSDGRSDVIDSLQSQELIELFLSLLRDLEPPAIIRKATSLSENQERTDTHSAKTCPYIGFRKDIVAVIGNCAYRRKRVQDEIRERNGILLLLQQCVTDEDNPFLREWGIWCVRNVLEGNAENQQVVADLELQGSIDVPELAGLGLKVELDKKTQRPKLVNVSSKVEQ